MAEDNKHLFRQRRLNTRLLEAVCTKNLERVKRALANGAHPNTRCRVTLMTASHLAAFFGLSEILEELITQDADLNVRDIKGMQPHHLAVYNYTSEGSLQCLKVILNKREDLLDSPIKKLEESEMVLQDIMMDSYDHNHNELTKLIRGEFKDGCTALYIAVKMGHSEVVKELIERKATVKNETLEVSRDLNKKEILVMLRSAQSQRPSMVPLQMAVLRGDVDEVASILPTLGTEDHLPLHLAIQSNLKDKYNKDDYNKILQMLLDKSPSDINATDENGKTPLYLAIEGKWMDDVDLLLEKGADLSLQCKGGETVIHAIARNNDCDILKYLLEMQPNRDLFSIKDSEGYTPLYRAVKVGCAVCVEALLETGAVEYKYELNDGTDGSTRALTILHAAVESNRSNGDVVKQILEYVMKMETPSITSIINDRNSEGLTALDLAAKLGEARSLDVLLRCGDVTVIPEKKNQDTPLHHAAKKGYYKCVDKLTEKYEGLVNLGDQQGLTALVYAARGGYRKCVEVLIKRGANLSSRDTYLNRTAIDIIMSNVPNAVDMITDLLDSFIVPSKDEDQLVEVKAERPPRNKNNQNLRYKKSMEKNPLLQNFNNNNNNTNECYFKDHDVKLDYKCLVAGSRQLAVIEAVSDCNYNRIKQEFFLHPLVKSFLFIKWKMLNKIYNILLFIYTAHVVSVSGLALSICVYRNSIMTILFEIAMVVTILPVILMEIITRLLKAKVHSCFETHIKWSAIVATGLLSAMPVFWWSRYLASVTVLLAWMELLLFYAMSRRGGFYILLFFEVAMNVFRVFSSFLFLITGFTLAFFILFNGASPFPDPFNSFGQVLAMISELNYDDTFKEVVDKTLVFQILGRALYIAFYVLAVMVMMNLIIGLSVNVVTEHEGRSKHLAMQGSFLSLVDKFCCPNETNKFILWLRQLLEIQVKSVFQPGFKAINISPNHPTKPNILEKELMFEVMAIVNNRNKNYRPQTICHKIKSMKDTLDDILETINNHS